MRRVTLDLTRLALCAGVSAVLFVVLSPVAPSRASLAAKAPSEVILHVKAVSSPRSIACSGVPDTMSKAPSNCTPSPRARVRLT